MGCGSSKTTINEDAITNIPVTTKNTLPVVTKPIPTQNNETILAKTNQNIEHEINIEETLSPKVKEVVPPQTVVSTLETKPNENNDQISNSTERISTSSIPNVEDTNNTDTHLNQASNINEPTLDSEDKTNLVSQATESVCSSEFGESLPDDNSEVAENILSRAMVDDVMASLTSLQPQQSVLEPIQPFNKVILPPLVHQTEGDNQDDVNKMENSTLKELQPSAGVIPEIQEEIIVPSYINTENDIALQSGMRIACSFTDNKYLKQLSKNAASIKFEKSFAVSNTLSATLVDLVSSMKSLQNINVSGNNSGPIAFRTLLITLMKCNNVTNLDISDNMADPECADLVGKLIKECDCLKTLNLAGNQLGKESLSRCLSTSIAYNSSLTYLNISGCGATNLHGLFEGLRSGATQIIYLDISNNMIKDGQQLGIDLSLILENKDCRLRHLNIIGTGLETTGWEAVLPVLRNNKTLRRLYAGGPENKIQNFNFLAQVIFANECLQIINFNSIKVEENLDSSSIKEDNLQGGHSLKELDIGNIGLTDTFVCELGSKLPGKLLSLEFLNISSNPGISETGMKAMKNVCSSNETSNLEVLDISVLEIEYCASFFKDAFSKLKTLNIRKARISADSLISLLQIPQILQEIVLDGIKLSGMSALNFLGVESRFKLTRLSLSGCALADEDLTPLANAIGRKGPPLETLTNLDLSVNRLTETSVSNFSKSLLTTSNHPLYSIDLSNNKIGDEGAKGISSFILSPESKSNLKKLLISYNCLSVIGIGALISAIGVTPLSKGLSWLDVSHQKNGLLEEEIEEVSQLLADLLGVNSDCHTLPTVSQSFNINLTKLGGSAGPTTRSLDSIAIKTDFSTLCNTTATFTDYLLISRGLDKTGENSENLNPNVNNYASFTSEEWSCIIGKDSPAWLRVSADRSRGVYINHLPGSTTVQRLEGMLEMEADCEVEEIYIIKDPVLRKPTGAAWVLFSNAESVKKAVQWYADGEAQMYGAAFTIGAILVETNESSAAQAIAKRELAGREKKRQHEDTADREMMEASQQLANERASYREAHPAYQNGRIW